MFMRIKSCFQLLGCVLVAGIVLTACGKTEDPRVAYEAGDYETAFALWQPAAETGDKEAQNALGTLYYLGLGRERDYHKALQWFEAAASQGHPGAQRNAAMIYLDGMGVPQDFYSAYVWLYASFHQGNESADRYIDSMVSKLTPNQQIKARADAQRYIVNPVDVEEPRLESSVQIDNES